MALRHIDDRQEHTLAILAFLAFGKFSKEIVQLLCQHPHLFVPTHNQTYCLIFEGTKIKKNIRNKKCFFGPIFAEKSNPYQKPNAGLIVLLI
jgi:hypothetical protein